MAKYTKKIKAFYEKFDFDALYSLSEGIQLVKDSGRASFDASVDLQVSLGINPSKEDQKIRTVVRLPHGTGKTKRVLVICTPEKEEEALKAGADYAGADEYLKKLENKAMEPIDAIVAMPNLMAKVGKVGRVIGPMGLMPSPKNGTVTANVAEAVKEIKAGKIDLKNDTYGQIHASIGRLSFDAKKLQDNILEAFKTIMRAKPSAAKGIYIKKVTLSSTMGRGVRIDHHSIK